MKPVQEMDRYLFGSVSAARPYLLLKLVLLLLALDAWIVMIEHGGRYGVGDFNVAHFALLDALQPVPSSGFYVGLMLFAGMLAFVGATGGTNRLILAVLAVSYTYGWAMSMLDSYQHHYLLTLVLITFVAFPALSSREIFGDTTLVGAEVSKRNRRRVKRRRLRKATVEPRPVSAWAYNTLMVSVAIVYAYTAIAKTEQDWRMGQAMQRIAPEPMEPIRAYFVDGWGLSPDTFWALVGHSVVMLQVVIAAGYLLAPLRDRGDRALRVLCTVALAAAVSFHVGAEYLGLRIGWFSWYMVGFALIAFLPEQAVWRAGQWLTLPARAASQLWQRRQMEGSIALPVALGTALLVGLAGHAVDLPGSTEAGITAGVFLVAATVHLFLKGRSGEALPWALASAAAALCMWLSIASSEVRYDYYRFVGGDARRRGEYETALQAYVKANRYAPEDDDRREKEAEMRRIVESRGGAVR